jgi:hypothetical protein
MTQGRMAGVAVGLLVLALLAPTGAQAADPVAKCRIRVILARKQGKVAVDSRIGKPLRRYLLRSFGTRYSEFKLLNVKDLSLRRGAFAEMSLPDKSRLRLKFQEQQGDFIKLKMEIDGLKTSLRIRDGGLFFQAGHSFDKGMMILAISASSSDTKKIRPVTPRPAPRKPGKPSHPGKRKIHKP